MRFLFLFSNRVQIKDNFLSDLRKTRELYSGEKLREQLHMLRKRLNDAHILSADIVFNMLISFRDLQVIIENIIIDQLIILISLGL